MSCLDNILGRNGAGLAIDLGTANTLVATREAGILINEPSVVAIDRDKNRVLAVGADAKRMLGRTPGNIEAIKPMRDGVIADFDVTEAMLRYFIGKACGDKKGLLAPRPRVVIGIPSGVTSVEKRAVFEAALQAGGSDNISVLVVDMRAECPSNAGWHAGKLGDDEDIDDALEGTLHTLRAVSSWRW